MDCDLSGAAYDERIAWIATLNRRALRDYRREGRRVELTYDASAAERVREFVERERRCCPFLGFEVRPDGDRILVTIDAPHDVGASADALFEAYTTRR